MNTVCVFYGVSQRQWDIQVHMSVLQETINLREVMSCHAFWQQKYFFYSKNAQVHILDRLSNRYINVQRY